jgi:[ribosomal protein S5]-alanine N-acetyltransferase
MTIFDTPAFGTSRLQVRPLAEDDEALYCNLYSDPDLMRHIAAPMSVEAARMSFRAALNQQLPHHQRWIISERETGHDVGLLGLIGSGDGPEIGVMLLGPFHKYGYGTEAMAGMVKHAFTTTALQVITARQAVADNPTVIRMMVKLGFRPLPPTGDKPLGGDWELSRQRWQAGCAAREVTGEQASR